MTAPIMVGLLLSILMWETMKLFFAWREGTTNFLGVRYRREDMPKAYWSLFSFHAVLVLMVAYLAAVLLWFWK